VSMFRRVRAAGRRGVIVSSVVALVTALGGGYFVNEALAAVKPPTPSLSASVTSPTTSTSVKFTFSDTQSPVTFKCSRDGATFAACVSGITYTGLPEGNHAFSVEAISGSNTSSAATFPWSVVPPTPSILTGPASPTTATTAKFTYSDTQAGLSFKCSRDGSTFSTCTSGISYSGLADGSHTFSVEAVSGSATSAPATATWTVDTTGPTVNVTFPANLRTYGTGTWNAGCAGGPGICGIATDPSRVASVRVGVLSLNTFRYWNGTSFGSTGQFLLTATGTTSWRLPIPVPPNGLYAVLVSATDSLGNVRRVAQVLLFSINTTAPSAPVITSHPASSTSATTGTFTWTDSQSGVTFKCTIDTATPAPCTSPLTTATLTPSNHSFSVVAVDSLGNVSAPATFSWISTATNTAAAINAYSGSPQDTTISTPFGAALIAKVTGAGNVPVQGAAVKFTAPSSGPSGTFGGSCSGTTCVVTTDVNGLATAPTFSANGTPGSYSVTAATGVLTPANFSVINDTSFSISGIIPGASTQGFYPGLTQSFNLSIANPYNFSLTVTGLTITVAPTTTNSGCPGTNLTQTRAFTGTVHIGANAPATTLTSLGATAAQLPQLTMAQSAPNACQGAKFSLTYTGSAGTP
jgi:hypothetical protein